MTQRYGNGQNIWEIAQIHEARIKYLRNGFSMLGMALEFDNRLKYVGVTNGIRFTPELDVLAPFCI